MAAEESYEDRQKRLEEAERKRRAEKRSKRFKKLWQMFGRETIKLETQAAREAVNALNLTQKDLRHLKREFDEIDVDQSGVFRCRICPLTRVGAVAVMA